MTDLITRLENADGADRASKSFEGFPNKRGQCDWSKTGWAWQYRSGACTCDPCSPPEGWKYDRKKDEWYDSALLKAKD